ncbi:hypothetical protein L195_g046092, partial [Trifolium pratense]
DGRVEENVDLRNGVESVRSVSTKHIDLLRPFARSNSKGRAAIIDRSYDPVVSIFSALHPPVALHPMLLFPVGVSLCIPA